MRVINRLKVVGGCGLCLVVLAAFPVRADVILHEDWSSGQGSWDVTFGTWQVGVPTAGPSSAYSDSFCAGTMLDGDYPRGVDTRLVSPPVLLERASVDDRIELSFYHWFSVVTYDSMEVQIRLEGGTWQRVMGPFTGSSPSWTRRSVDLTDYAGSVVELGFRFFSDPTFSISSGWYLDDIALSGIGPIYRTHLAYAITTAGDAARDSVVIPNFRTEPVSLSAVHFSNQAFCLPADFEANIAQGVQINPGASLWIPILFTPSDEGSFLGMASILGEDSSDTLSIVRLQGTGRALAYEWISEDFYRNRPIAENEQILVAIEMRDYVEADSIRVYYSQSGSSSFESTPLSLSADDPVNDRYTGFIPGSAARERGVQFYFEAFNGNVVCKTPPGNVMENIRVKVSDLVIGGQRLPGVYSMLSIPLEMENNTIIGALDDDLGARTPAVWRLWTYDPHEAAYMEYPDSALVAFSTGTAYWLITDFPVVLDTAPLSGISTPADSIFTILLERGWNQIGDPFAFPVAWESILVDGMTMAEAETLVVEKPWAWVPEIGYQPYIQVLEPFQGYWVRNISEPPRDVLLEIPPREASGSYSGKATAPDNGLRIGMRVASRKGCPPSCPEIE